MKVSLKFWATIKAAPQAQTPKAINIPIGSAAGYKRRRQKQHPTSSAAGYNAVGKNNIPTSSAAGSFTPAHPAT